MGASTGAGVVGGAIAGSTRPGADEGLFPHVMWLILCLLAVALVIRVCLWLAAWAGRP